MNWYYVDTGRQSGPVDDATLADLVRTGKIQADTLVWRDGLPNWRAYREIAAPAAPAAAPAPAAIAPAPAAGTNEAICAECGGVFSTDDMLAYRGIRVCAACKPVLMQKLSEGARIGVVEYASFWARFAAKFVDAIILRLVLVPMGLLTGWSGAQVGESLVAIQGIAMTLGLLFLMAYVVFFLGRFGATPGKMALKIKVIAADGAAITYGRAFGRFWAELLSGCPTLFIGYLMAASDDEKRALHDRLCNTRVVVK